jgi:putative chitinase
MGLLDWLTTTADPTPQPTPAAPTGPAAPAPASGPFTAENLGAVGISPGKVAIYLDPLNAACLEFEINTPARAAQFLAQVAWESEEFKYAREIWGPTATQKAYEGRKDLGNTQPGDGFKFRGGGLIETTGRYNFGVVSKALFGDPTVLQDNPDKIGEPETACRSAAWYWQSHGCNELADSGNFTGITKKVNGGLNGLEGRLAGYELVAKSMGIL